MTAPIWMAVPPEVHSALLSSGPGAGPLLASAAAWSSLSTEYAETAQELAAALAAVQTGAWVGPTAVAYAAAHVPYLAWLTQASANSVAMATRQETAAAAWTTALAAMPTLPELAANHATHGVLAATNFFGINTIPIALNEADYARMWIQAATVMSAYQAITAAAVDTVPQTTAAPAILKNDALAAAAGDLPPDQQSEFYQFLERIGYIKFYDNYIQPLIDALTNLPFFQALFSGFDPYLVLLGNPLTYFSPFNIAFALGYPMDIASYVAYLSQMFFFVGADLTAALASGNPATIGFTILFVTVEVIGTVITDTIALLKTLLEQTIVLLVVVVPLLIAPLIPLAAGAVLAPIGVKGLVALAAVPPAPPVAPPVTPPLAALAPSIPTSTSSPAPAPAEATISAPAPGAPPPTASPPTLGTGVGLGMGAGMENFGYAVGDLGSVARRAAVGGARKKAPEPDSAEEPTTTPAPSAPTGEPRRRKAKVRQLGRGYEYMDLEPDVGASKQGAGPSGFAGTVPRQRSAVATGLATLGDDAFGGGPRMPMMPGNWDAGESASESDADL